MLGGGETMEEKENNRASEETKSKEGCAPDKEGRVEAGPLSDVRLYTLTVV